MRDLEKENRKLLEERGILRKPRPLFCSGDCAEIAVVHRFIAAQMVNRSVSTLCRVLEVSPSGFYAAQKAARLQAGR